MILVLITIPKKDAKRVARVLLDKHLSACVNIIESVSSLFLWQGKIDTARESLLVVKTTDSLFKELEKEVATIHPYDVPEIIGFKVDKVNKPYYDWLNKELNSQQ